MRASDAAIEIYFKHCNQPLSMRLINYICSHYDVVEYYIDWYSEEKVTVESQLRGCAQLQANKDAYDYLLYTKGFETGESSRWWIAHDPNARLLYLFWSGRDTELRRNVKFIYKQKENQYGTESSALLQRRP